MIHTLKVVRGKKEKKLDQERKFQLSKEHRAPERHKGTEAWLKDF